MGWVRLQTTAGFIEREREPQLIPGKTSSFLRIMEMGGALELAFSSPNFLSVFFKKVLEGRGEILKKS